MDSSRKAFFAFFASIAFAFSLFLSQIGFADTHMRVLTSFEKQGTELVQEGCETIPFDELILCWNAIRANSNDYPFWVSLRQRGAWSPFLYYGDWGIRSQMLTGESPDDSFASTSRGVALVKQGVCDGSRIRVVSAGVDKLSGMDGGFECYDFWPLHVAEAYHLTAVGYDIETKRARCLDPIFPADKATSVAYGVDDFIRLWAKRQNIACIFENDTDPFGNSK